MTSVNYMLDTFFSHMLINLDKLGYLNNEIQSERVEEF